MNLTTVHSVLPRARRDEAKGEAKKDTEQSETEQGVRYWWCPGVPCGYGQGKTSYGVHFYAVAVGQAKHRNHGGPKGALRYTRTAHPRLKVRRSGKSHLLPSTAYHSLPVLCEETRLACGQSFPRKQSLFPAQVVILLVLIPFDLGKYSNTALSIVLVKVSVSGA